MPDVAPPGMPEPQPQGQPPAQGGAAAGSSNTGKIIGAIALVIVIAVGAFFLGRSVGINKGEDNITAEYQPGQPKYNAIYIAGQNAGKATGQAQGDVQGQAQGKQKGKKIGLEQGQQQGTVTGANDVFNAFSGGWDVGSYYIVQIGQGTNGVDYTLDSRREMVENQQYALCSDNPDQICVFNPPTASSSSGGSGGSN